VLVQTPDCGVIRIAQPDQQIGKISGLEDFLYGAQNLRQRLRA